MPRVPQYETRGTTDPLPVPRQVRVDPDPYGELGRGLQDAASAAGKIVVQEQLKVGRAARIDAEAKLSRYLIDLEHKQPTQTDTSAGWRLRKEFSATGVAVEFGEQAEKHRNDLEAAIPTEIARIEFRDHSNSVLANERRRMNEHEAREREAWLRAKIGNGIDAAVEATARSGGDHGTVDTQTTAAVGAVRGGFLDAGLAGSEQEADAIREVTTKIADVGLRGIPVEQTANREAYMAQFKEVISGEAYATATRENLQRKSDEEGWAIGLEAFNSNRDYYELQGEYLEGALKGKSADTRKAALSAINAQRSQREQAIRQRDEFISRTAQDQFRAANYSTTGIDATIRAEMPLEEYAKLQRHEEDLRSQKRITWADVTPGTMTELSEFYLLAPVERVRAGSRLLSKFGGRIPNEVLHSIAREDGAMKAALDAAMNDAAALDTQAQLAMLIKKAAMSSRIMDAGSGEIKDESRWVALNVEVANEINANRRNLGPKDQLPREEIQRIIDGAVASTTTIRNPGRMDWFSVPGDVQVRPAFEVPTEDLPYTKPTVEGTTPIYTLDPMSHMTNVPQAVIDMHIATLKRNGLALTRENIAAMHEGWVKAGGRH